MPTVQPLPTIRAIIAEAHRNLSPRLADYVAGGASGEQSLGLNTEAFKQWAFDPDMLTGLSRPDTSAELFGMGMSMPVFSSPFGYDKSLHPEGYKAVAEAIGQAGVTGIVSESTSDSMWDIAPCFSGQQGGVQVALVSDIEHVLWFDRHAADAGYRFLCLTDSPTRAWRERMRENGLDLNRFYGQGNYGPDGADKAAFKELMEFTQPRWDWQKLEKLSKQMTLPWVLKGVIRPEDARHALNVGAAGVYISSYGGRNLDGSVPSLERLEAIRSEVGPEVPILFDSGVRHGSDVAKALALGATAVGVGRLTAYGLAAGSLEDPGRGARALYQLLNAELGSIMGSLGCQNIGEISRRHVVRL